MTSSLRLAGLWPRFASLCYEVILLVAVLFIAAYLFLALTHDGASTLMRPLLQLWLLAVLGAYFLYCWLRSGQTLAMKTWHLRLAQIDGTQITPRQALARLVVALWGLFLLGAGFLWALVDRDRQFLHDRLAGTRIFTTRNFESTKKKQFTAEDAEEKQQDPEPAPSPK